MVKKVLKSFLPNPVSSQRLVRTKSFFQVETFIGTIKECTNKSKLARRKNVKILKQDIYLCFDFGYSRDDQGSKAFAVMRKYSGQYKVELLFL